MDANHPQFGDAESTNASGYDLGRYRRIVLLTDGHSTSFLAKTAINMLRYRTEDCIAVFDATEAGKTAQSLFGTGGEIPVVGSLEGLGGDAIFVGIAPPGGVLPKHWRSIIEEALARGMDVVSGLHDFITRDPEYVRLAQQHGCRLIDVRRNSERDTATCQPFRSGCLRIHTVGHDCSIGKMVVSVEVERELCRRGIDAKFLATGQTGIMISGEGVPIDCVVSDFVNGAAEKLVRQNEQHDIVLVEGQGSISHPSFSAVTLGLLHGCAPDGLILCYEVGRTIVKGLDHVPLQSLETLAKVYETLANLRHPCKIIGVGMNSRVLSAEQAAGERERVQRELGLPVCDVYRDGAGVLADAVLRLRSKLASC